MNYIFTHYLREGFSAPSILVPANEEKVYLWSLVYFLAKKTTLFLILSQLIHTKIHGWWLRCFIYMLILGTLLTIANVRVPHLLSTQLIVNYVLIENFNILIQISSLFSNYCMCQLFHGP